MSARSSRASCAASSASASSRGATAGGSPPIEVMFNTARIADLIREPEKTDGILEAIEEGAYHQMQSFSQHLVQLVARRRRRARGRCDRRHQPPRLRARPSSRRCAQRKAAEAAAAEVEPRADRGRGSRRQPRARRGRLPACRSRRRRGFGSAATRSPPRHARARRRAAAALRPRGLPSSETPNTPGSIRCRRPLAAPPRPSCAPTSSCSRSGRRPAPPTASRGRCSARSTRSSRTSAATWARARPARSAGCSSCRPPGCAGEPTPTATASRIPWDPEDAVFSAARYLAAAGGARGHLPRDLRLQPRDWYVDDVLELARVFSGGGGFDATLGTGLGGSAADRRGRRLPGRRSPEAARGRAQGRDRRAGRGHQAGEAEHQLDAGARRRAARRQSRADRREFAAPRRRSPGRSSPTTPRSRSRAQAERAAPSGAARGRPRGRARGPGEHARVRQPVARSGHGSPIDSGQFVFPVGGGPSSSRRRRRITTIPAADIAAPMGSPLYALADGIVMQTFPERRRTAASASPPIADGTTYLYCHLSYMEPHITPGTALAAGAVGRARRLHRPLDRPAPAPPVRARGRRTRRRRPWFQSFAGVAFSWQGEAPAPAVRRRPRSARRPRTARSSASPGRRRNRLSRSRAAARCGVLGCARIPDTARPASLPRTAQRTPAPGPSPGCAGPPPLGD